MGVNKELIAHVPPEIRMREPVDPESQRTVPDKKSIPPVVQVITLPPGPLIDYRERVREEIVVNV